MLGQFPSLSQSGLGRAPLGVLGLYVHILSTRLARLRVLPATPQLCASLPSAPRLLLCETAGQYPSQPPGSRAIAQKGVSDCRRGNWEDSAQKGVGQPGLAGAMWVRTVGRAGEPLGGQAGGGICSELSACTGLPGRAPPTPHLGAGPLPHQHAPPPTHVLPSPPLVTLALTYINPISHTGTNSPAEHTQAHPDKEAGPQRGLVCLSCLFPSA